MPLLRNGSIFAGSPCTLCGGSYLGVMRSQWGQPGSRRGFFDGAGTSVNGVAQATRSSVPAGYPAGGGAIVLAQKAGGMTSYNTFFTDGGVAISMAAGINMDAPLDGSGDVSGPLGLIVSMFCTILSNADIAADMVGIAVMASTLAGSGDVAGAISALANLESTVSGSGSAVATVAALAHMEAVLSTETDVVTGNPSALASAVWEFLIATGLKAKDALRRTAPTREANVAPDAGNSPTSFKTDLDETEVDHWKDALVCFSDGLLTGQIKKVNAYDPVTSILTIGGTGFSDTPADWSSFVLINR